MTDALISEIHKSAWAMLKLFYAKIYQAIDEWNESEWYTPSLEHIKGEIRRQLYDPNIAIYEKSLEELYKLSDEPDSYIWRVACYLEAIRKSLVNQDANVYRLRALFEGLSSICDEHNIDIWTYYEGIEDCLDQLAVDECELIYLPKQNLIALPNLIIEVHDTLIRKLAETPDLLFHISPRKFEEVIAELFFNKGFHVELTKTTRDGGKDIIAIYEHLNIRTKYIIECKRYARTNKVSLELVQRLLGVKFSEAANKAILATTSTFTRDARLFAKNHIWDLDLKEYEDIVSWIKSYQAR